RRCRHADVELDQRRRPCRRAASLAFGSYPLYLLNVSHVAGKVAQVEAVNVPVGNVYRSNPVCRWWFVRRFFLVLLDRRFELALAKVALDPVAVQQPECGTRK